MLLVCSYFLLQFSDFSQFFSIHIPMATFQQQQIEAPSTYDICPTKAFVDWLSILKETRVLALSLLSLFSSSNFFPPCVLKRPTGGLLPAGGLSPPILRRRGLMLRTCTELFQVTLFLLPLALLSSSSTTQQKCAPAVRELIVALLCAGHTGYARRRLLRRGLVESQLSNHCTSCVTTSFTWPAHLAHWSQFVEKLTMFNNEIAHANSLLIVILKCLIQEIEIVGAVRNLAASEKLRNCRINL